MCLHLLLSGEFPWDDDDEDVLEDLIIQADLDLTTPEWRHVSDNAKDLKKAL